ncbi:MAG: gene transfer agent major capsid protein [Roseibaca calidilacus]|uniref:Gene transfer agent major capsid protein n=1 Tax=Roseibaca calidilacus TaxID=1666912 RepID=A0A0P7WCZ5_9RHOB|nr:phage major capsid protein [Roseibaca calidilacus]KPP95891.1 MAG: gene transfer agent major capsid protein [Roseibaca calidilacus]CUX81540.1 phage major capsid protein, HK97 family [Roseibaca calidilacus]
MTTPAPQAAGQPAAPEMSDAPELKTAWHGFAAEFDAFQADLTRKLSQTEERLTMLDRKTALSPARPVLDRTDAADTLHHKAFDAYLRSGNEADLRGLQLEAKGLNTAVAAEGGYLVDPATAATIRGVLHNAASIRAIASVVMVESSSFDVLVDHTDISSGWATESGNLAESDTPTIDRISIRLHELSAMPKASQRLLDDSAFDIEGWLADRIAGKFARAEAAAFINGDGVDKPRGFLDHPKVDDAIWEWDNLGYIATGADGDFASVNAADSIVDLVYALGASYRANAVFVMNSKTAGAVRKMKDADGRFLWSDGLASGEPARLMGYPVLVAEDMPDIASDSYAIAFGDFNAGYTIAERPDMRVLRDPFSAKPHVLFYATKRVGGDVSDFKAIKLLKFGLS